jgi:hypothetical protein
LYDKLGGETARCARSSAYFQKVIPVYQFPGIDRSVIAQRSAYHRSAHQINNSIATAR